MAACASLVAACAAPARPLARAPLPSPRAEDWPMFRDDVERSGFAEGSLVGAHVDRIWQIPSFNVTRYGAAKGSPSVVGDLLFYGTDTGRFLAARVADGSIVWQVQLDQTSHGIHGSPAIVGDTVYIGAYDGTLYAFERATGLLEWRHKVGYQIGSSPAVVPEYGFDVYQRIGDGARGWHEEAPFDRIILTSAPREVPPALLEQLADGGILVAPVDGEARFVKYVRTGAVVTHE